MRAEIANCLQKSSDHPKFLWTKTLQRPLSPSKLPSHGHGKTLLRKTPQSNRICATIQMCYTLI